MWGREKGAAKCGGGRRGQLSEGEGEAKCGGGRRGQLSVGEGEGGS